MKIPYIKGEYRQLFKPIQNGGYVNDHCIIYGNGEYHLFGITSFTGNPTDERYFVHATGANLESEFKEVGRSIDCGTLAWSPCVVPYNNDYYMFYGPSPTSLAVSPDFYEWFGFSVNIKNEPPKAMHRDHFVLKLKDEYLMYTSGVKDGQGCISVARSSNLIDWEFYGYALTCSKAAPLTPAWGALESPFIVERDGKYYLFVTYTDCSDETYNNTLVFASENPLDFGCYFGGTEPVAEIYAHAPEILHANGKDYITTCGWKNSPTPHKGYVSIAELEWK